MSKKHSQRKPTVNSDNYLKFSGMAERQTGIPAPDSLKDFIQPADVKFDLDEADGFVKTKVGSEPVVDFLNFIFLFAASTDASDIHFSAVENGIMVRLRDKSGELNDILLLKRAFMKEVELKLRAKCHVSSSDFESFFDSSFFLRNPQTDEMIDVRVSFAPTRFGQNIVCRILRQTDKFRLENLRIPEYAKDLIHRSLTAKDGIVLISGPTGSGKSTTLFCFLNHLNRPDINIMTVEDPVEYRITGANQVSVSRSRSFAGALRTFLRQDPDVIMVGELRDQETAETAMKASNTGHLVFSTIHTNNAAQIITRLMQMGCNSYLIADTLLAFTAQRLARHLCPHCRQEKQLTDEEVGNLPVRPNLRRNLYYVMNKNGCQHCHYKGFNGKIPVMEIGENTPEMKKAVETGHTEQIQSILNSQPQYRTLREEALAMSAEGLVDFVEALSISIQ